MTRYQIANHLRLVWDNQPADMPRAERFAEIEAERRSLPRPDDEYEFTVGLVREAMALTTVSAHDSP